MSRRSSRAPGVCSATAPRDPRDAQRERRARAPRRAARRTPPAPGSVSRLAQRGARRPPGRVARIAPPKQRAEQAEQRRVGRRGAVGQQLGPQPRAERTRRRRSRPATARRRRTPGASRRRPSARRTTMIPSRARSPAPHDMRASRGTLAPLRVPCRQHAMRCRAQGDAVTPGGSAARRWCRTRAASQSPRSSCRRGRRRARSSP